MPRASAVWVFSAMAWSLSRRADRRFGHNQPARSRGRCSLPFARMTSEGARREEVLETAATLFASSGLRTSLKEIADAAGILPGSLYHHFDSKEAIIVELVRRYQDDLDMVAKEAVDGLHEVDPRSVEQRVVDFGEAIAVCAVRHRAALLLTLYDPPTTAGDELGELARQTPSAIYAAMFSILEAGHSAR